VDPFHEVERHEEEFVSCTYEKQNALEKKKRKWGVIWVWGHVG
jgi:hypothetical protein